MKEALKRISSPFDTVCFNGGGAHHKGRSLVENPKSQPFSGNADNRPFSRTRQPACRDFLARVGHIDEWHLVGAKAVQQITFGFSSWFPKEAVVFRSAFSQARFIAIGSVSDAVGRDRIEQLLVKGIAES